jgi:hypothetical protein
MCISSGPVSKIYDTLIASFHVYHKINNKETKSSQLIVYKAKVNNLEKTNAFILPVYNPGNDTKKIIPLDLSDQEDFFEIIDNIFRYDLPGKGRSKSKKSDSDDEDGEKLEVHSVGNYIFSLMSSKEDFNKLDNKKLKVNPHAKVSIDAHSNDYSFIVCQYAQKGELDLEPFGYLCSRMSDRAMMIPTIHGHPSNKDSKAVFKNKAKFDHNIYCLTESSKNGEDVTEKGINSLNKVLNKLSTDYKDRKVKISLPDNFIPQIISIHGNQVNRNISVTKKGEEFLDDLEIESEEEELPKRKAKSKSKRYDSDSDSE